MSCVSPCRLIRFSSLTDVVGRILDLVVVKALSRRVLDIAINVRLQFELSRTDYEYACGNVVDPKNKTLGGSEGFSGLYQC